jgi:argininosuccinate synthase
MQSPIVLLYDEYHTPVADLRNALTSFQPVRIILGDDSIPNRCEVEGVRHVDRTADFADRYLSRAIRANARYQQHYNLSAALARPALAEAMAEIVAETQGDTVIHGFAGNDQLRFETGLAILCPQVAILSVADLLGSRTQANADGVTRSANLWGDTLEGGPLSDPAFSSAEALATPFEAATTQGADIEIGFEAGLPVSLGGRRMALAELIAALTEQGRAAGIMGHDLVEDGHVGLKTRALYDSAAADILNAAHADLVRITSSRSENRFRPLVESRWAELVYDGGWFDPLRELLDLYLAAADRHATGTVTVAIRGGQIRVVARSTGGALYDEASAVYRAGQDFGGALVRGLRDQAAQCGRLVREREGHGRCED